MVGTESRATAFDVGIATGLALGCIAVYAASFGHGFVSFDDPAYIVGNLHVQLGLTFESVRWAFTHAYSDNWHPLTWLSHMLDVELFGQNAAGHHGMSAALHGVNAALFYALLLRLTGLRWPSALAAGLFAFHPLRVESVAWASERKDVLSGLFFLLTLHAYGSYAKTRNASQYCVAALCFALGLLAKPMLVTLPLLLVLLDRWPLERSDRLFGNRKLLVEKIPFVMLSILSSGLTLWAQSRGATLKSLEFISVAERMQNAAASVAIYLQQFLWPADLAFFYPHPALVQRPTAWPLAVVAGLGVTLLCGVTLAAIRLVREMPYLAVGWFWYLAMLLPVIGLVQVGAQGHADRYTYLPGMGIAIATAFGLHAIIGAATARSAIARQYALPLATTLGLAWILGLALASQKQVGVWQSSERLYRHALSVTENNYIAAFNIGADASAQGRDAHAIIFYTTTLQMRPNYAAAHSNLGASLSKLGREDEALEHFEEAIRLDPQLAQAAVNLGNYHAQRNNVEAARGAYQRALAARPDLPLPHEVLAEFESSLGHLAVAHAHLSAAVGIDPGSAVLQTKMGQLVESQGEQGAAIGHYRRALELDPALLPAIDSLAWLLATTSEQHLRDGRGAVELAEASNRATNFMNPSYLKTLAVAQAVAGDRIEALKTKRRAMGLTPGAERPALREQLEAFIPQTTSDIERNDRNGSPPQ
ncbi:MAG: tetratricopeptide (TPR) repeat protein [Myxococcota bacterium]|jgi:tetratricopeptide (TPR) repeat protein